MSTILGITGVFALILGLMSWNIFSLKKEEKQLKRVIKYAEENVTYWEKSARDSGRALSEYVHRTPMEKLKDALTNMGASFEIRDYGDSQGILVTDRKKPVLFTFDSEGNYKA